MRKAVFALLLIPLLIVNLSGCVPLIVGGALGAAGAYAVSKDTIQGETDKPYDSLWEAAVAVSKIRGTIKQEDSSKGYIELQADASKVYIRLIRLTQATTRLKVSARKYHMPNISLAQEIFLKIEEQAR